MPDMMEEVGRIDMIGLTYGEHLMVWGLRRIVTARSADDLLRDEFSYAFADDGGDAMGTFCAFLCLLGRSARRTLEIGLPGSLVLTGHEHRILTLLAAAQRDEAEGGPVLLGAHLQWLTTPANRTTLTQATLSLARLLACHGHWLPVTRPDLLPFRAPAGGFDPDEDDARVIHVPFAWGRGRKQQGWAPPRPAKGQGPL